MVSPVGGYPFGSGGCRCSALAVALGVGWACVGGVVDQVRVRGHGVVVVELVGVGLRVVGLVVDGLAAYPARCVHGLALDAVLVSELAVLAAVPYRPAGFHTEVSGSGLGVVSVAGAGVLRTVVFFGSGWGSGSCACLMERATDGLIIVCSYR